jgi:hypothetical protein
VLGKGNQIWIWQGQWLGPASFMSRCWTDVDLAFSLECSFPYLFRYGRGAKVVTG